jgi:23S rRNA pseudouridine1911/1915/1917 synthase
MSNKVIKLRSELQQSQRLDSFLADQMSDFSRSRLQQFIKDGLVSVDGNVITRNGFKVNMDNEVTVTLPEEHPTGLIPEEIPIDILYEDERVLVINKPAGMVVHPSAGHSSGTLVHAVLAHCSDLKEFSGEIRPGVVHRLDRDTSGIIIMAKDEKARTFLQKQFKSRELNKRYLALTDGKPPTPTGRIEAPIGRDPLVRKRMAVLTDEKGREALTEYRVLEDFPRHSLIEAHPFTGRTHQIRVHLAFLKCPIVGDELYGLRKKTIALGRHFLHASSLTILLPDQKQPMTFSAPLPPELETALNELRSSS